MVSQQQQLEAAIRTLESQRSLLGNDVIDASVAALRAQLAALKVSHGADATEVLKQLTVLFVDVVGSTVLSQRVDSEAFAAVIENALKRGTALVEEHGGRVMQYAGDNILAAFGVDEAREDNAERAVRCGLALLALGKVLGDEVQAAHGHAGLDVRAGIHTGGVLLYSGIDADISIRGLAVNIAARMEQTAHAGSLRISQNTYAQVRGLFEVHAQEPLAVKGVDEPVRSYLVIRAKPRSFRISSRGIEGVTTRMIGRDTELEALREAFMCLFADPADRRGPSAVTVVGDAGVGKSRLLHEFESWTDTCPERFHLFRGRATPQTQGQPYGLLRDILAGRLGIADDDSVEVARRKMEDAIIPLFAGDDGPDVAEGHAHLLGHLIGIEWTSSRHLEGIVDDPKQIRNRAFHAAAKLIRLVGARDGYPVVLELEDLHWADHESFAFLNYLAEVERDIALLILAFTRPLLFERGIDWMSTAAVHRRIDLAPLDHAGSRLLADELLQKLPEVPAALRELVTRGAEGNPFYMEELVQMLIDRGTVETGDVWKVNNDRLLITEVPPTLTGVLQARLDGLPAGEKSTLQKASVIGPVFWEQALVALDPATVETLPLLVRRELVLPHQDAATDTLRAYAFRHHLLHQVTYDTVLMRSKRELHAKVAQWLSSRNDLRMGDFLGATAEHYARAGDAMNAAEFHARAAEHAEKRWAHESVLMHVGKALELFGEAEAPELRWRLLDVREAMLAVQGRREEQAADLDALERLAEVLDDDRKRAHAAWRRGGQALEMGDLATQESAARRMLTWAERANDPALRLSALRLSASAQVARGEVSAGRTVLLDALAEARRLGLRYSQAMVLTTLSVVAGARNDALELLELTRESLRIRKEIGDRRGEAVAMMNLGAAWIRLGDFEQARRDLDEALRIARSCGDRFLESNALCDLAELALCRNEDARAQALARSALKLVQAARARSWEAFALLLLGEAERRLRHFSSAREAFEQALAIALEIDDAQQHDAAAGLARVALDQDDGVAAMRALRPLLEHVERGGTLEGTEERMIEWTIHRVLAQAGDPRAAEWLARAHDALQAEAARLSAAGLQRGFLENIPHHRAIMAAWTTRHQIQQ